MAAARSTQLSSSALLELLSFILRCLWHRRTAVVPVISRSTAFLWQCPTVHLGVRNVYPGPTSHGEIIPSWLFPSDHACITTLLILLKQCARAIGQLKTRATWAQGVWGMKITHCHRTFALGPVSRDLILQKRPALNHQQKRIACAVFRRLSYPTLACADTSSQTELLSIPILSLTWNLNNTVVGCFRNATDVNRT